MAGKYDIELVPSLSMVRLTMSGFFEPQEICGLGAAIAAAVKQLGAPPNQHVTLCDIRGMEIQSQDAVAAFTRLVATDATTARQLAFVTPRSLSRLQARRLTSRPGVEFFDDVLSAEQWLNVPPAVRTSAVD